MLTLQHTKLDSRQGYCAQNHVIPPKPLRSNAKKLQNVERGNQHRGRFNTIGRAAKPLRGRFNHLGRVAQHLGEEVNLNRGRLNPKERAV